MHDEFFQCVNFELITYSYSLQCSGKLQGSTKQTMANISQGTIASKSFEVFS